MHGAWIRDTGQVGAELQGPAQREAAPGGFYSAATSLLPALALINNSAMHTPSTGTYGTGRASDRARLGPLLTQMPLSA